MAKTGSCVCGKVSYTLKDMPDSTGACHCETCRKWSGGIYLGFQMPPDAVEIHGAENLTVYPSSDWAERAFCSTCGSNIYYRVTAPGPHHGNYHLGFGTLDEPGDIPLTSELFVDVQPKGYSFAQETHKITGPELFAMFAAES